MGKVVRCFLYNVWSYWPVCEYICPLSRNVPGLACCSENPNIQGGPPTNVDRRAGACGRLDGSWITGSARKHFRIFISFSSFHYYRDNFSDN